MITFNKRDASPLVGETITTISNRTDYTCMGWLTKVVTNEKELERFKSQHANVIRQFERAYHTDITPDNIYQLMICQAKGVYKWVIIPIDDIVGFANQQSELLK